ncbi:MAG TPA: DUF2177 family protein [Rhizomicrobium sp.]|nr:DUF2177 family protein [Rhizomicrobium sp.]
MSWVARYVVALLVLGIGDALWLSYFAHAVFRPTLGTILLDDPRWLAVGLFYLAYPVGVLIFAVSPALRAGSAWMAIIYGALFGLFAYGTYDATNFATIKAWTVQLATMDTAWGVMLTALSAVAGYLVSMRG